MSDKNYFTELSAIDVKKHIEKKGKFSYLSWPFAVETLGKHHPTATWEIVRHNGMPFLNTECGFFVEVTVTIEGVTKGQLHPVLDNRNQPIAKPTSFQINTSIQRALVKAIALHGLGLYIYAGEDLPIDLPEPVASPDVLQDILNCGDMEQLKACWNSIPRELHYLYTDAKDKQKKALEKE